MNSIRNNSIIFIFFIFSYFNIYSQTSGFINVKGNVEKEQKPLPNAIINLIKADKIIEKTTTKNDGSFSIRIPLLDDYILEITQNGLITMKFRFNTNLPDNVPNDKTYDFQLNVQLFQKVEEIIN